jgi:hypothetical protein
MKELKKIIWTVSMNIKTATNVTPALIAAYNATRYRVFADETFDLRIGQKSNQLSSLYQKHDCLSALLITAWNPYSAVTSEGDNRAAQDRLESKLLAGSVPFITAIGQDAKLKWPGEESVLALGLSLDAAKSLGIEFLQNAILWSDQDAIPKLVMLR